MKTPEEIFNLLKEKFGDVIISLDDQIPVEKIINVDPLKINEVCRFLHDDENLQFDALMSLSGVDDANGEKATSEDGSFEIKGGTLSVFYHLHSTKLKHKVTLKVSAPRENPEVESVVSVWRGANWHEREAFDMFGIKFLHHPDLRRILMPYDWPGGYPLRKDYKNPEFYHGLKIHY